MEVLDRLIITDIVDIVTIASAKGRYEKMRNRACYGLSFCTEGQITYTHNGKSFVSDPEHAVILPKNQSYTIQGDKKGIFPLINFECRDFLCDTIMVFPVENASAYINDYEQMKALFLFEKNRAKVMSIFYDIIHRLSSHSNLQYNVLIPAIKYLESNYQDSKLTNEILANKCKISEIYFRKLFAEQYGITPRQYIIDIRISKAKQLLIDGVLKINAVSEKCGFSNPYHFCRAFKQKTGVTPTEYMKDKRFYGI